MWHVYHLGLLILSQAQILTGSTILRKSIRLSVISIFLLEKTSLENLDKCVFFSNVQALGTLWDFNLENHFQDFIGRESNWPISCLNDSENQEKGALRVKIQKISQWNAPGPL